MWANEPWTKRWDGFDRGNDGATLLAQTYDEVDWEPHFRWLLRFLTHRNYIRVDGKPM